jgi:hypothetical protein
VIDACSTGRVAEARYRAPFDLLFAMPRFEYQCLVGRAVSYSNLAEVKQRLDALPEAAR